MRSIQGLFGALRPRPLRQRHGSLGIDLSLRHLHVVQMRHTSDGRLALHARVCAPWDGSREETLASPARLRRLLTEVLSGGRFRGKRAVIGMPAGRFRTLSVNYRPRAGQSDDQGIAAMMAERLDGDLADYVIDYVPVRSQARDAEKLAIVAVSQRSDVLELLEAVRAGGLSVDALEIGPVAIRRLANALPDAESQMRLIVNTGRRASYLTMLSGRRLLMDQPIEFSEQRLLEALQQALDIDEASALSMVMRTGIHAGSGRLLTGHREGETGIFNTLLEIIKPELQRLIEETDRAFMYAAAQARGGGEASIWLLGALARWPGADRVLADLTHLPVTNLDNPLRAFSSDDDEDAADAAEPGFAVALGLSLRGLVDDD